MTHIYKAKGKDKKEIWMVNETPVNLRLWRNGKRFGLKQRHINKFDQYIKDYKLDLR